MSRYQQDIQEVKMKMSLEDITTRSDKRVTNFPKESNKDLEYWLNLEGALLK